jgi:hypothetical protein
MFEYEAEIRLEMTEETFEELMGREVKNEKEWDKFVDAMIDAAYNCTEEILQGNVKLKMEEN